MKWKLFSLCMAVMASSPTWAMNGDEAGETNRRPPLRQLSKNPGWADCWQAGSDNLRQCLVPAARGVLDPNQAPSCVKLIDLLTGQCPTYN